MHHKLLLRSMPIAKRHQVFSGGGAWLHGEGSGMRLVHACWLVPYPHFAGWLGLAGHTGRSMTVLIKLLRSHCFSSTQPNHALLSGLQFQSRWFSRFQHERTGQAGQFQQQKKNRQDEVKASWVICSALQRSAGFFSYAVHSAGVTRSSRAPCSSVRQGETT